MNNLWKKNQNISSVLKFNFYITCFWSWLNFLKVRHEVLRLYNPPFKATLFLFVGLRYPLIWKIAIWQKKLFRRQVGNKFTNIGILLFPWKMLCLLIYQILNICNYEVLFGLIYQKMVTCKCYAKFEKYSIQHLTMSFFLFFWLLIWKN